MAYWGKAYALGPNYNSPAPDGKASQAAYESAAVMGPTMAAGTNFVLHAAGWLEGGLTMGYEKLMLDGFQAGLSWITILRKREAFRRAFDDFAPEKIARYDDTYTLDVGLLPPIDLFDPVESATEVPPNF